MNEKEGKGKLEIWCLIKLFQILKLEVSKIINWIGGWE